MLPVPLAWPTLRASPNMLRRTSAGVATSLSWSLDALASSLVTRRMLARRLDMDDMTSVASRTRSAASWRSESRDVDESARSMPVPEPPDDVVRCEDTERRRMRRCSSDSCDPSRSADRVVDMLPKRGASAWETEPERRRSSADSSSFGPGAVSMPKDDERRRTGVDGGALPDEVRRSTLARGVADGVVEVDRVPSMPDEPVSDDTLPDNPLSPGLEAAVRLVSPLRSSMSVVISAMADATAMAVARPMDDDRLRPLGTLRTAEGATIWDELVVDAVRGELAGEEKRDDEAESPSDDCNGADRRPPRPEPKRPLFEPRCSEPRPVDEVPLT
mmetsp:Transcript_15681/g.49087  ORF Transcript_15681/g.49087 Transcript_15681/m.49087 type:complete len:331 (-) Transcript_15681:108-1100(-)